MMTLLEVVEHQQQVIAQQSALIEKLTTEVAHLQAVCECEIITEKESEDPND